MPILQPDPMRGGFTDLRKTAVLAETCGQGDRAAPVPGAERAAFGVDPERRLDRGHGAVRGSVRRSRAGQNGMITAPERPGHGLAFKPEILRDCKVKA